LLQAAIPDCESVIFHTSFTNTNIVWFRGFYTTIELLKRGAKVYIFSRSKEKIKAAIKDIKENQQDAKVEFMMCDLGDLDSVKKAGEEFLRSVKKKFLP